MTHLFATVARKVSFENQSCKVVHIISLVMLTHHMPLNNHQTAFAYSLYRWGLHPRCSWMRPRWTRSPCAPRFPCGASDWRCLPRCRKRGLSPSWYTGRIPGHMQGDICGVKWWYKLDEIMTQSPPSRIPKFGGFTNIRRMPATFSSHLLCNFHNIFALNSI